VLLDIQLPTLSGLDVVQQLRQLPDPHRAATPVIALTANVFQVDVERYLAAGFNDYLAKPYEEAELYQKIERLLPFAGG
jgi:CheY-like chemotaxis protein